MDTQTALKQDVLREIEALARKRFLPIIGPVKGKYLAETVARIKPRRVIEIGTLIGYSAILMAINLQEDGRIHTIEINPESAKQAQANIQKANLTDKIIIHIGDAIKIIPTLKEEFDMAFLDAEKGEYLEYLRLCEPKLRQKAVVFADNTKIFASHMQDYLDYVRSSGKYSSQFIDVGFDGVEISTKLF